MSRNYCGHVGSAAIFSSARRCGPFLAVPSHQDVSGSGQEAEAPALPQQGTSGGRFQEVNLSTADTCRTTSELSPDSGPASGSAPIQQVLAELCKAGSAVAMATRGRQYLYTELWSCRHFVSLQFSSVDLEEVCCRLQTIKNHFPCNRLHICISGPNWPPEEFVSTLFFQADEQRSVGGCRPYQARRPENISPHLLSIRFRISTFSRFCWILKERQRADGFPSGSGCLKVSLPDTVRSNQTNTEPRHFLFNQTTVEIMLQLVLVGV
ncbi:hypothetical protein GOODEAATRI_000219 [Goodea atripinnis]|uniref:Uncharacterized protein n=1 Tax=Goodea atripinnis TaxID=208336 RepID=A0ABV0MFV9_9TELE